MDDFRKSLTRFIINDPEDRFIILEILDDDDIEKELNDTEEFVYERHGEFIKLDTLKAYEEDYSILSFDFKFLEEIEEDFIKGKVKIDQKTIGIERLNIKIKRLMKNYAEEDLSLRVLFCSKLRNKIVRENVYTIVDSSSSLLILEDEDGDEEKINWEE